MEEKELRTVHELYAELADYFEVEVEDTEYYEHGTFPGYIHKEVEDHKEAIRLLSGVLEEETELPITELESWHEDYENTEWAGRHGKVSDGGYDMDKWDNPVGK